MLPAVALAVPCKHRGWLDTLLFPDPVDVHVDSPESACTSNSSRDGTEQLVHPRPIPAAPPNSTHTSTRPPTHPHAHTWPTRPHPLASLEPHTPGRRWCEVHPLHRRCAGLLGRERPPQWRRRPRHTHCHRPSCALRSLLALPHCRPVALADHGHRRPRFYAYANI